MMVPYGPDQPQMKGKLIHAEFTLAGEHFMAMDAAKGQNKFSFTPSTSFYTVFENEAEIDEAYKKLSDVGSVLMEFQKYPFANKYAWINDKFGVSRQLILPNPRQQ
jgi:predicted 3-demethylubiquinone-9 3-methyltransferase (glyoxalase superfamily)